MFSAALNDKLQKEAKKREEKHKVEEKLKVIREQLRERYEQRMDMLLLKCLSNPIPQEEEFIFAEKFSVYKDPPKYKVDKDKFLGTPSLKLTDNSNEQNRRRAEIEKNKLLDTDLAPKEQFIFRRRHKEREIQPRMIFEPTKKLEKSCFPDGTSLNRSALPGISSVGRSRITSNRNDHSLDYSMLDSYEISTILPSNRPVLPPFRKPASDIKSTIDDSFRLRKSPLHLPFKSIKHYSANPNSIELTNRYSNYSKVIEAYDTIRYNTISKPKIKRPPVSNPLNNEVPHDPIGTDGYCLDDSMLFGEDFVNEVTSDNYQKLKKRRERDSYRESVAREILKSQTRSVNVSIDYK